MINLVADVVVDVRPTAQIKAFGETLLFKKKNTENLYIYSHI